MTLAKRSRQVRPTNEKLANSSSWTDCDCSIVEGWLDEYRVIRRKHTPSLKAAYLVLLYLSSRQRYRDKYEDRVINETIDQMRIANGVLSYGTAQDVVQFLEWVGVLVTVREGGKGNATIRQLLKPDYAKPSLNPVIKEQRETGLPNGIKADTDGIKAIKQRDQSRNSKRPRRQASTTPASKQAALVDEDYNRDASLAARDQVMAQLRANGTLRPRKNA